MVLSCKAPADLPRPHRERMRAVRVFVAAVRGGNPEASWRSWKEVTERGAATSAMRAAARLSDVPTAVQAAFLEYWILQGDTIRDAVNNDDVLIAALRKLLPCYSGPGLRLYRGDSVENMQRGVYGLSWSADKSIARHFAQGIWQMLQGGSVVLEVDAPAGAIISADMLAAENHGEGEYIVDVRLLRSISVAERFAQRQGYPR